MRKNKLLFALALTPLLMGANGSKSSGLTVTMLPSCADTEYLTYRSGGLACTTVTGGGVQFPDCSSKLLTVRKNGDVSSLTCTDKGKVGGVIDTTILTTLETKVTALGVLVSNIGTGTGSGTAVYAGNSTATSNGNLLNLDNTADNALAAAAKVCATQFGAGAHMCSVAEIYESAVTGVIGSAKNITKAWVYAPNWQNPIAGSVNPTLGYGDTCGSYTYPTGDKNWKGMAVSTGANEQTTRWGIRWIGGADAGCASTLPVACCK